jgi:hypothetical protein
VTFNSHFVGLPATDSSPKVTSGPSGAAGYRTAGRPRSPAVGWAPSSGTHYPSDVWLYMLASQGTRAVDNRSTGPRMVRFVDSGSGQSNRRLASSSGGCALVLAAPRKDHVRRWASRDVLGAPVSERQKVDVSEEVFAGSEQDWSDREVHFVDESGAEVLAERGHPSSESDVLTASGIRCFLERHVDTAGHEAENRASFHGDRCSGVMGKHEDRRVVRRVITPPALPAVVRPGPSDWPEHIAAHDPRSNSREAPRRKVVVDAGRSPLVSVHLPKGTSGESPIVQGQTANSQRMLQVLPGTGSVAVEGDGEGVDSKLGHGRLPFDCLTLAAGSDGVKHRFSGNSTAVSRVRCGWLPGGFRRSMVSGVPHGLARKPLVGSVPHVRVATLTAPAARRHCPLDAAAGEARLVRSTPSVVIDPAGEAALTALPTSVTCSEAVAAYPPAEGEPPATPSEHQ